MGRLEGKRAIVTGAGSGLGRATVYRFALEGARVECFDIDGAAAMETAEEVERQGGKAIAMTGDVSTEADTERMVAEAISSFGGVDVLFANAGIAGAGKAADLSCEDWNRVISVNLTGVWLSCKAALKQMLSQGSGGSIICTSSVGGLVGTPSLASYAAAKAGVIGLVKQMAVDYGPDSIRVNAICPGTVPTPLVRRTYEQGGSAAAGRATSVEETLAQTTNARFPLHRLGREEDVAGAALYLASDESSWVTGTSLVVDGGMTAQ